MNILNIVYTLRFFFCLQNAVCFIILKHFVPVLFTFYIQGVLKLKKNNSGAKSLNSGKSKTVVKIIHDLPPAAEIASRLPVFVNSEISDSSSGQENVIQVKFHHRFPHFPPHKQLNLLKRVLNASFRVHSISARPNSQLLLRLLSLFEYSTRPILSPPLNTIMIQLHPPPAMTDRLKRVSILGSRPLLKLSSGPLQLGFQTVLTQLNFNRSQSLNFSETIVSGIFVCLNLSQNSLLCKNINTPHEDV